MIEWWPPAMLLLFGAMLIAITRAGLRTAVIFGIPVITLWLIWQIPDGVAMPLSFLDYPLEPVEGSAVRRLFATVFAAILLVGGLFAYRTASRLELAAAFAYAGGAVGVTFAGDLITLFVFWEIMAVFSTVIVWCGNTHEARAAGLRYAGMHLLGGVMLMVGIVGFALQTGSVDIQPLRVTSFATAMILAGLLINAAAPPLSAWLADAYPEASPSGTVFLSAFTTKTAVLALILLFPGEPLLIGMGIYMIFYGIVYALLENDARRILAYSIVNQVGFMVCAIGIGTQLAINGAAAHASAHIIYKALLLMSAGVVLYRTGQRKCTDLGGLFRTMPLTCFCCVVGALSISSFPLTSGFTTKTLISEAAVGEGLTAVYFLLAAASAGVFLHAGIKFPWFVFFQKDSGLRPQDAPWNMAAAMLILVALCVGLGVAPQPLYDLLPYSTTISAYSPGKVLFYLQLLLFSGLAFFLLLPLMKRTLTITLDVDWFWRKGLYLPVKAVFNRLPLLTDHWQQKTRVGLSRVADWTRQYWAHPGVFSRSWSIGTTAAWIVLLLTGYVLIYYA